MDDTISGALAMQWAREISKVPEGTFTIAFYQYSRSRNVVSNVLTVRKGCEYRKQMPKDSLSIDSENLFLFTDRNGEPKMCYRILVRYIAFPNDGFKMHKIDWLL